MNPYGNDMTVDQVIGSAYQVVRYVAANMETLIELSDSMDTVKSVLGELQSVIDNMPALLEISGNLDILSSNVALLRGNREAIRRSYAEAGYNLVDGSFEAGGTLVNANDVLLQESTGKAFSGTAGTVAAGTNPVTSPGWKPVTENILRAELSGAGGVSIVNGANYRFGTAAEMATMTVFEPRDGDVCVTSGYYAAADGGGIGKRQCGGDPVSE